MRIEFVDGQEVRDIPGFEGRYAASKDGRIWSYPKAIARRTHPGMWLRPGTGSTGYYLVVLNDHQKKRHTVKVHRAVASAWIPNPEDHPTINHINGIPTDNCVCNLEWCSQAHNNTHAHRTGLNPSRGAIEDVQPILEALAAGRLQKHIAEAFGVSQPTISAIKAGRYRPARFSRQPKGAPSHAN